MPEISVRESDADWSPISTSIVHLVRVLGHSSYQGAGP